jgi:hypothetical protein
MDLPQASALPDEAHDPLGPFRPPARLEPEFHAPVPRPIPDSLRRGRYAHRRRVTVLFGALFALSALGAWVASRGTTLDHYFLALPYFHIVAAVAAVLTVLAAIAQVAIPGRYAYVRHGIPMPCRIRDVRLVVSATANGAPSAYRYLCAVEYQPPGATQRQQAVLPSPDFSEMFKEATETPLRTGDYVTAVALPGRIEQTLTLYGFLQISPDVDFVRRKGSEGPRASPVVFALGFVSLVYVFIGLLLAVTCLPAFLPIGLPESVPLPWIGLAVVVALAGAVLAWRWIRAADLRRRAELEQQNERARREGRPVEEFAPVVSGGLYRVLLVIAGGFIPVLVGSLALATVNAVFDASPPAFERVRIKDFSHETRLGLFRSYDVRWVDGAGKTQAITVPVTHLDRFQTLKADEGALERKSGFLRMPWVKDIHPVTQTAAGTRQAHLRDGSVIELER